MFKNLVRAPQRDAYDALKKKVEAAEGFRFPVPLSANATLGSVCHHVEHVEELLEEREVLLHREGGLYKEWTINWLERRVDESVAAARLLVHNQVFHRLRRSIACTLIQRTCLKRLYHPATRPGRIPLISRSLLDEGFLVIGSGDSDGES